MIDQSPHFSIVMPVFNREREIQRAIESCLAQTFMDFEIVVVDDGSTDHTADAVAQYADPRVCLVRHDRNRGVCPARNTAVRASRGSWRIYLDSDHEMLPGCLARAVEFTGSAADVDRFGFLYRFDDGRITPSPLPAEFTIGYREWLEWIDTAEWTDALWFTRRACFDRCMLPESYALEFSYFLDFARLYRSRIVPEVLAFQHTDSPNRLSSTAPAADPALGRRKALDQAEDWQRVLSIHGAALKALAPAQYRAVLRGASLSHTLAGQRWRGIAAGLACLREGALSVAGVGTLVLALAGARVALWTIRARARRCRLAGPGRRTLIGPVLEAGPGGL